MRYIEPYVGTGSILLNKEKSVEEVVSDPDESIINLWKVIKDECKILKNRLSKVKYAEKNFNELKNLSEKEKEYSKQAFYELILRRMSKNDNKQVFDVLDKKKASQSIPSLIESLDEITNRISNVYFIKRKPIELISNFSNSNTLCFCSPDEKEKNKSDFLDVYEKLKAFRGKVVFCAENSPVYKRVFLGWKFTKNKNKNYVIWYNF
jgi:DNA adenine methylase